MCTGSAPWPYITAGILWSRRILRAAPLPNCVRFCATSLLSDTKTPVDLRVRGCGGPRRGAQHGGLHRVDHGRCRPKPCGVPRRGTPESLGDASGQREIRLVVLIGRLTSSLSPAAQFARPAELTEPDSSD